MRGGLVEQPARNELQAIRRIDQATIQRWTGDFGNRARLRPSTASTQRIATCVDQRQTQEVGCALHPPRANKSFEFACRLFNRHELADPSQSRGPGAKPQRIAHAWLNRSPMVTVMLTPMGVGGGGREICQRCSFALPPSPVLPHKGGGSRPSLPLTLSQSHRTPLYPHPIGDPNIAA